MEEKPLSHQVKVIRINNLRAAEKSDNLEIVDIGGYQVVVKKGEHKIGDWAYYVQPDSIVPIKPEFSFLWESKILPGEEPSLKQRRISARRFRGNWSEGLLMPFPYKEWNEVWDGLLPDQDTDISDFLGITHYQPPEPEDLGELNERGPKSAYPRSAKGWMYWIWYRVLNALGFDTPLRGTNEKGPKHEPPFYDIENFKNHVNAFEPGEEVWVSEKIHGCQGRYVYQDGHMYTGSRRLWKSTKSKCIWRTALALNPWIEEWCKAHEGFVLYGELTPCQGEKFMYGCKPGEISFKVFDILTPKCEWLCYNDLQDTLSWSEGNITCVGDNVPTLYQGPFDIDKIKTLADGKSVIDGKTIREGVVVKPIKERHVRGLGRLVLKLISNQYLEKN